MAIVKKKTPATTADKRIVPIEEPTRKCTKCGEEKVISLFPPRKDARSGAVTLYPYCRPCKTAYENEVRLGAALRRKQEGQRKGLRGLPYTLFQDGDDKLILNKDGSLNFDCADFDLTMHLTKEARKKLIVALGGVSLD